jgi:S-adenosylmethionine hydrolase
MSENPPIISILTDFGDADAFVGTMKGVMLNIAPHAQLVDLTNLIPPQDVRQAAFILMTAAPYFPEDTVHLIVVDPGVGSTRRAIAVQTPHARYVAPDNGVLTYALAGVERYTAVELANPKYQLPVVSTTFHGRDIFSPAAAHLAAGVPLEELGPVLDSIVRLDAPHLVVGEDRVEGEVVRVDHFGNLRTSIHFLDWHESDTIRLRPMLAPAEGDAEVSFSASRTHVSTGPLTIHGVSATFSSVQTGQPVAFVGSENALEIAVNQGNAAREFDIDVGDRVTLTLDH